VVLSDPPDELSRAVEQAVEFWLPLEKPNSVPSDSEQLRSTIDRLQSSMLNGYRVAYSGQLRRLEWWADVIELLAASNADGVLARVRLGDAEELVMDAPSRVPEWAFNELENYRLRTMIRVATSAMAVESPSVESVDLAESVVQTVRESPRATGFALEAGALEARIKSARERGQDRSVVEALTLLEELRGRAIKLENPAVRVQMLSGVDAQALALLVSALGTPQQQVIEAKVQPWRKATEQLAKQLDDEVRRTYQCWALGQIEQFDREVLPCYRGRNDLKCIRLAMERLLLPINETALEAPINQKYSKSWSENFDALDDDNKRLLLQAVGFTRKLQVGDVTCR
jgi:hypothetical protein